MINAGVNIFKNKVQTCLACARIQSDKTKITVIKMRKSNLIIIKDRVAKERHFDE